MEETELEEGEPKKTSVCFRIDTWMINRLRALAARTGASYSWHIRRAVAGYLEEIDTYDSAKDEVRKED